MLRQSGRPWLICRESRRKLGKERRGIVGPILTGRHDPELTVTRLMADTRIPLDWAEQRHALASA